MAQQWAELTGTSGTGSGSGTDLEALRGDGSADTSYEGLVRAHIKEWFRGAEKYQQTTQLSRRPVARSSWLLSVYATLQASSGTL